MDNVQPRLANIRLHPIKALDPAHVNEAHIGPAGGLEFDRVWALYSADGKWVNGKNNAASHWIRAAYSPDLRSVTLFVPDDGPKIPTTSFAFPDDTAGAAEWFSKFFKAPVTVRHSPGGFPDDTIAHGPTIVSTASLQAVCELFPGMTLDNARRRFRTTMEIDGVPAFWEDQLFSAEPGIFVPFRIGQVDFEGSNPCARCPVPPRDPQTGAEFPGFQKRFTEQRRATLPSWSPQPRFNHFYRMATNTRVASSETGKLLRVGDFLTPL